MTHRIDPFEPLLLGREEKHESVDTHDHNDDLEQSLTLGRQIREVVDQLRKVVNDAQAMNRLHEVEQMIVRDVAQEGRHMKCRGCLRWMAALVQKAHGDAQ